MFVGHRAWARNKFFAWLLAGLLLAALSACGGSATSPQVSLPTPISGLISVSSPDEAGQATVIGAPGAVPGGAEVEVTNLGPVGGLLKDSPRWAFFSDWLVPDAHAASSVIVTAAPDGSFKARVDARVGDPIQIIYRLDGAESLPLVVVVPPNVFTLEPPPLGLQVNGSTGQLYVSSGLPGQSVFYAFNLNGTTSLFSLPDPLTAFVGPQSITALAIAAAQQKALGVSPSEDGFVSLDLQNLTPFVATVPLALNIATLSQTPFALIAMEDPNRSFTLFNMESDTFPCNFLIPPSQVGLTHVATAFIESLSALDDNLIQQSLIFALSLFTDNNTGQDTWVLTRAQFNGCGMNLLPLLQVELPPDTSPADFAVVDANRVLVTDQAHDRSLLFQLEEETPPIEIAVGRRPQGIAVNSLTNRAYVVNSLDNSVTRIDLDDLSTQTQTGVGLTPTQISVDSNLNVAAVLSEFDASIIILPLDF